MRAACGEPEIPGNDVPEDRAKESAQDNGLIHLVDVDHPLADGLGNGGPKAEGSHKIEKCRPYDCLQRSEHPGGDDCGDGIGGVVEAVEEIEHQGYQDNEDDVVEHACLYG